MKKTFWFFIFIFIFLFNYLGWVLIGSIISAWDDTRLRWLKKFSLLHKPFQQPNHDRPTFIDPSGEGAYRKRHRRGHRGGKKHRKHFHRSS